MGTPKSFIIAIIILVNLMLFGLCVATGYCIGYDTFHNNNVVDSGWLVILFIYFAVEYKALTLYKLAY